MTLQSILVATDLSAAENSAVRRALRLAIAHDATLRLKYMPPTGQRPAADAAVRLAHLARQLQEVLHLRIDTASLKPHKVEDLCAQARGADLLVLPHRRERSTAAFFRGQPVARLLRAARCPVLVTRQSPDADYRRILVAVDAREGADALVQMAGDLDAHAQLALFHAADAPGPAGLRADGGDPGRQIVLQQERSAADLVVVGKRRSSAWEDFFRGSVAHRVLSWGSSDVLVVPLGLAPATADQAVRRLRAVRPALRFDAPTGT